ncbi:hypothetical protein NHQ30_001253 [Ciborinia camelliae]|nr:hypothetical protein NHQ30_001253 [Ciborinia camelliae]
MVISKLVKEDSNFITDLLRSGQVEIVYLKDGSKIAVKWPTVAVKAISTKFRGLDKYAMDQSYTIIDCLGESQDKFEAKMLRSNVSDLMDHFGKWLYTGIIDIEGMNIWDMWTFGEALGTPRYQNDIMRALCAEGLDSNPSLIITEYIGFDAVTLKKCWEQADFTADEAHKCSLEQGSVYWGNKQMLKFVMDVIVFVGLEHPKVRRLIFAGGYVAEHISKLALQAARGKTFAAPWKSRNNKKYLVNETILVEDSGSEREIDEDSTLELKNDAEDDEDDSDDSEDEDEDEEMEDRFKTDEE